MLRRYLVSSNALTYLILALNLVPELESVPENTTAILDQLLDAKRYNKGIRPDFGGPPLLIKVNLLVKSFGSISETDQSYTMDIYFRQTWTDRRLSFSIPGQDVLSLSWLSLNLVWKPDTFFTNGKKSHLHRITVPNKFLRVRYDGFITYSMRQAARCICGDSHWIPRSVLSTYQAIITEGMIFPMLPDGYRRQDVMYAWCCSEHEKNVEIEPKVEIAQYDLINITTWGHKVALRGNSGKAQMVACPTTEARVPDSIPSMAEKCIIGEMWVCPATVMN
uniref:Neurotransmitter-gated ion-channel ligand-binding domain-containing protein n=1 Tax=Timema bartmani TaxID=61472 RepID=A0A7R9F3D0_9NEOP|nr:unnamed protein product [Timema bartmani]